MHLYGQMYVPVIDAIYEMFGHDRVMPMLLHSCDLQRRRLPQAVLEGFDNSTDLDASVFSAARQLLEDRFTKRMHLNEYSRIAADELEGFKKGKITSGKKAGKKQIKTGRKLRGTHKVRTKMWQSDDDYAKYKDLVMRGDTTGAVNFIREAACSGRYGMRDDVSIDSLTLENYYGGYESDGITPMDPSSLVSNLRMMSRDDRYEHVSDDFCNRAIDQTRQGYVAGGYGRRGYLQY
jgi:hypothetical protein